MNPSTCHDKKESLAILLLSCKGSQAEMKFNEKLPGTSKNIDNTNQHPHLAMALASCQEQ